MKKLIALAIACVPFLHIQSQVGIGTTSPHASAQLDISSNTKGTLITRMTTSERKAIVNPANGLLVYDLDKKTIYMYDTGKWQPLLFASNDNKIPAVSIQPADLTPGDFFGQAVSISGDYAIVGAPLDTATFPNQGSAYIFFRNNGTWTQQAKLYANTPQADARFGQSVCIDGNTAIVGAPNFDDAGGLADEGRAYVFTRTGTSWLQVGFLLAGDRMPQDFFGSSVSISGNYAVVGAPSDDGPGGLAQGSVYVFNGPWIFGLGPLAKLTASDASLSDFYGSSVDINGDYIIVGAPFDDGTALNQGSAYIYYRLTNPAGWTNNQPHQVKLSGGGIVDDQYGSSVSINSTFACIGVPGHDAGISNRGAVYTYKRNGVTWPSSGILVAPDAEAGMVFGYDVSLDNDYLLIGANRDDSEFPDQGSAYLYHYNGTSFILHRKIYDDSPETTELFGYAVGISGMNVIIGAPYKNAYKGQVSFLNFE